MNPFPLVFALSIILAVIHILSIRGPRTLGRAIEILLLYQLVVSVGIGGLLGFYGHIFKSIEVAEYIGWPPQNPFQYEVGYANLTFGILGILCIWFRGNFWVATVLGISIWYLANAYGHIREILINRNYSPGNAGIPLYTDIFLPLFLLGLLVTYLTLCPQQNEYKKCI